MRPAAHFFDVITNGYGVMYSYAARVAAAGSLGDHRLYPRAAAVRSDATPDLAGQAGVKLP